ncbi:MAG: hypoxanthine phosphoribosyltransferase [Clostridia bacterium]|nr:hypoxanthine phosphoribosyltransferase [Clostridia bacterium]
MERIKKVLISESDVKDRVKAIAREISEDYKGKTVTLICILSGASIFFADLVRELDLDLRFEFMSVSSYGAGTVSSGEVKILKDVNHPIAGKDVIIVEDIIDSGCTLSYLKRVLEQRAPASIKICTILDKPCRRKVEFKGDYVGFEIPDEFVIGYGLDYDGKYRNLKDVCVLELTED